MPSRTDHQQADRAPSDFDFMFGNWTVQHRRLRARLVGCLDWDSFTGRSRTAPILGGHGNIEDNVLDLPGGGYRAIALRSYDVVTGRWAIWWLDGRSPHSLDTPVVGAFNNNLGEFLADDTVNGTPTRVRFLWRKGPVPRWEQAFSVDGGATWETNWTMDFTRTDT